MRHTIKKQPRHSRAIKVRSRDGKNKSTEENKQNQLDQMATGFTRHHQKTYNTRMWLGPTELFWAAVISRFSATVNWNLSSKTTKTFISRKKFWQQHIFNQVSLLCLHYISFKFTLNTECFFVSSTNIYHTHAPFIQSTALYKITDYRSKKRRQWIFKPLHSIFRSKCS